MNDYEKTHSEILSEIETEVDILIEKNIISSQKIDEQSKSLEKIIVNNENIAHETKVSKWHLRHIASNFGKIFKKINYYPIKKANNNSFVDNKTISIIKNNEDKSKLNIIHNKLKSIKEISTQNGYMLDIHNDIVDEANDIVDKNFDLIKSNQNRINRLLK
jgi:hypothetical protein